MSPLTLFGYILAAGFGLMIVASAAFLLLGCIMYLHEAGKAAEVLKKQAMQVKR